MGSRVIASKVPVPSFLSSSWPLVLLVVFAFVFQSRLVCQETVKYSRLPRPYIYGGIALNGMGYEPFAFQGGTGLSLESPSLYFQTSVSVDNAHKKDSGTGRGIGLSSLTAFRVRKALVGAGMSFSELKTSQYVKRAWRPNLYSAYDFVGSNYSCRIATTYVLTGQDKTNGTHGAQIAFTEPSPVTDHHWFFHETLGIYRFHTTITEPRDLELTALQTSKRFTSAEVAFSLMYRF